MKYDVYFGYRENYSTTRVDFPSFTACDGLYTSKLVNADWFL